VAVNALALKRLQLPRPGSGGARGEDNSHTR
jgi:hypothetical protein